MLIDRRSFLHGCFHYTLLAGGIVAGLFNPLPVLAAQKIHKETLSRDEWMAQWMGNFREPGGTLHLSRFRDPMYFLTQPITWSPNTDQVGKFPPVKVPTGFVTDFASIPQIFWSILRPDGDYTYPAILHDYLYWRQNLSRDDADEIFKFAMEDFDIDKSKIILIYEAVRKFGQSAWDSNARAKAHGEKRVLIKYPTDPRVRWIDWKSKPGVFGDI